MLTKAQVLARKKIVTRRLGWWFLKPSDHVQPVEKGMGLKKGERVKLLGFPIEILSTRPERVDSITKQECIQEGFPEMEPKDFIEMFCKHNKCKPDTIINRIFFLYT
jgi:hypothetical protein